MGRWAWVPSPWPLPGLSLLLLLFLASLRAQPQAGKVSADPIALWPLAPCVGLPVSLGSWTQALGSGQGGDGR